MADDHRDVARLKGGIAGLKYLIDELRTSFVERTDEIRDDAKSLKDKLAEIDKRLAVIEARHEDMREEVTARHRVQPATSTSKSDPHLRAARPTPPPVEKRPSEALETLKAIGPWLLGALSLIGTLVNALVHAAQGSH